MTLERLDAFERHGIGGTTAVVPTFSVEFRALPPSGPTFGHFGPVRNRADGRRR
jgi:hypothetical protein